MNTAESTQMAPNLTHSATYRMCPAVVLVVFFAAANAGLTTHQKSLVCEKPPIQRMNKYWVGASTDAEMEETCISFLKEDAADWDIAMRYGWFLSDRGRYSEAEEVYKNCIEAVQCKLGKDSCRESILINDLVQKVYYKQKRFAEAERQLKEVLRISVRRTGTESLNVWDANESLAWHYFDQRKFDEALPYFVEAARIGVKDGRSELDAAQCYLMLRDYHGARPYCEMALRLAQSRFGTDSKIAADCADALACVYQNLGNNSGSELYRLQELRTRKMLHGERSVEAVRSLNRLGRLYTQCGRHAEAENVFLKGVQLANTLKEDDDLSQSLSNNLAQLYLSQGKIVESIKIMEQCLADLDKVGAVNNSIDIYFENNLAVAYTEAQQYEKAEKLLRACLAKRKDLFGPTHADVAVVLNNLGSVFEKTKRYAEAESFYSESIRINRLHENGLSLAASLHNFASLNCELGRLPESVALLEESVRIEEKIDMSQTALSLHNLASVYLELDRLADAETACQKAISIRKGVFGPSHSYTISSQELLKKILVASCRG